MADVDVDQWLEGWVENNLNSSGHAETKADMRDHQSYMPSPARRRPQASE